MSQQIGIPGTTTPQAVDGTGTYNLVATIEKPAKEFADMPSPIDWMGLTISNTGAQALTHLKITGACRPGGIHVDAAVDNDFEAARGANASAGYLVVRTANPNANGLAGFTIFQLPAGKIAHVLFMVRGYAEINVYAASGAGGTNLTIETGLP